MSSRWQASKIGLINFWYYDEQEFPFVKGRMLLRGSNGSGKSVTMQSVVPLLLDGNMSPERLDPFGSAEYSARDKMECGRSRTKFNETCSFKPRGRR